MNPHPEVRIGDVVGFVLHDGELRPAHVVRVIFPMHEGAPVTVNLQILLDGPNDSLYGGNGSGLVYRPFVAFSDQKFPGTWHWLEEPNVSEG